MKRNPSQLRAITHLSGPMMVLAGPRLGENFRYCGENCIHDQWGEDTGFFYFGCNFSRAAEQRWKTVFEIRGTEQKRSDFWNFPRNFLWDFESGLSSECGQYSFWGRKFSILREMTEKYGQEMAQEGDFIEEVAKEISVVKGNCISPGALLCILLLGWDIQGHFSWL